MLISISVFATSPSPPSPALPLDLPKVIPDTMLCDAHKWHYYNFIYTQHISLIFIPWSRFRIFPIIRVIMNN